MNKDAWESLTGTQGWADLKRYLLDWRARVMEELADGKIPNTQEAIYKCQMLKDLANLAWDDIDAFYRPDLPARMDNED